MKIQYVFQFEVTLDNYKLSDDVSRKIVSWYKDQMVDTMNYYQRDIQQFNLKHKKDDVYQFSFYADETLLNDVDIDDFVNPDTKKQYPIFIRGNKHFVSGALLK